MIKYLIKNTGKEYKANLHSHSTVSDGRLSPEEVKREYLKRGYSIVAFTDHDEIVKHKELKDENFLPLVGAEFGIVSSNGYDKNYHLNFISKKEDNDICSVFNEIDVPCACTLKYVTEAQRKGSANLERKMTTESVNEIIKRGNDEGFLVILNHPIWSELYFSDYVNLKGLWGIEVFNNIGERMGICESGKAYDDMLKANKKIFPVAADDSHSVYDMGVGALMVKAESLTYENVIKALENGDFYATNGPLIKEITFDTETNKISIKSSDVYMICVCTDRRETFNHAYNAGEGLTVNSTVIDLTPYIKRSNIKIRDGENNPFIRVVLKDMRGNYAYTKAFYLSELYK